MSKGKSGVYVLLILAMIWWGCTFVAFKFAILSFRPITIVFFRLFVSIFFLFGFAWLFKKLNKIKKKDQKSTRNLSEKQSQSIYQITFLIISNY